MNKKTKFSLFIFFSVLFLLGMNQGVEDRGNFDAPSREKGSGDEFDQKDGKMAQNSIKELTYIDTPGIAKSFEIVGGWLFSTDGSGGLVSINITDRFAIEGPYIYDTILVNDFQDIVVSEDIGYIANGYSGLIILNLSDPRNPTYISEVSGMGNAQKLCREGDFLYISSGGDGLSIVNVSDVSNPEKIITHNLGNIQYSTVIGSLGYIADSSTLRIFNVSNPLSITEIGMVSTDSTVTSVWVEGFYVFVSCEENFYVYNASDFSSIQELSQFDLPQSYGTNLYQQGQILFESRGEFGVGIYNLSNLQEMKTPFFLDSEGCANDVFCDGNTLFIADGEFGVGIFELTKVTASIPKIYTGPALTNISDIIDLGNLLLVQSLDSGIWSINISNLEEDWDPINLISYSGVTLLNHTIPGKILLQHNLLVSAIHGFGIRMDNISKLDQIVLESTITEPENASSVWIEGNIAFITDIERGFFIYNISDIKNPEKIVNLQLGGDCYDLWVSGDYAYVSAGYAGLHCINITNLYCPRINSTISCDPLERGNRTIDFVMEGNIGYLTTSGNLTVINYSRHDDPQIVHNQLFPKWDSPYGLEIQRNMVSAVINSSEIVQLNYTYPENPVAKKIDIGIPSELKKIHARGDKLFVSDETSLFAINFDQYDFTPICSDFQINMGESSTNYVTVDLSLDSVYATEMCFSNDTLIWTEWIPYSQTQSVELEGIEGINTVYVRTRNNFGESQLVSDSIEGNTPTIENFEILSFAGQVFNYHVQASISSNNGLEMSFSNDSLSWTPWEIISSSKMLELAQYTGQYRVYIRVRNDFAEASSYFDVYLVGPVNTAFLIGDETAIITNSEVELITQTTNATEMRFSEDGVDWDDWQAYEPSIEWVFEEIPSPKTLYVQFSGPGGYSYILSQTANLISGHEGEQLYIENGFGYLADGKWGLCIFQLEDDNLPIVLSYADLQMSPRYVTIADNRAYLTDGSSGLAIVDVTDKNNPEILSEKFFFGNLRGIEVVGDYAFIASYNRGLVIFDISNPTDVTMETEVFLSGKFTDVEIEDELLYLSSGESGIVIFDISNPTNPLTINTRDTGGNAESCFLFNQRLFVADGNNGITALNNQNPFDSRPSLQKFIDGYASKIWIVNNYAFVCLYEKGIAGLEIANLEELGNPVYAYRTGIRDLQVEGNTIYYSNFDSGIMPIPLEQLVSIWNKREYSISCSGISEYKDRSIVASQAYGAGFIDSSDFSSQSTPSVEWVNSHISLGTATSAKMIKDYLFISNQSDTIAVVEVKNYEPLVLGTAKFIKFPEIVNKFEISDSWLVATSNSDEFFYVDISNPYSPGSAMVFGTRGVCKDFNLVGSILFIAEDDQGMTIIDLSNPVYVSLQEMYSDAGANASRLLSVDRQYCIVYDFQNGLVILDISNVSNPLILDSIPQLGGFNVKELHTENSHAFLLIEDQGFFIINYQNGYGNFFDFITLEGDSPTKLHPNSGSLFLIEDNLLKVYNYRTFTLVPDNIEVVVNNGQQKTIVSYVEIRIKADWASEMTFYTHISEINWQSFSHESIIEFENPGTFEYSFKCRNLYGESFELSFTVEYLKPGVSLVNFQSGSIFQPNYVLGFNFSYNFRNLIDSGVYRINSIVLTAVIMKTFLPGNWKTFRIDYDSTVLEEDRDYGYLDFGGRFGNLSLLYFGHQIIFNIEIYLEKVDPTFYGPEEYVAHSDDIQAFYIQEFFLAEDTTDTFLIVGIIILAILLFVYPSFEGVHKRGSFDFRRKKDKEFLGVLTRSEVGKSKRKLVSLVIWFGGWTLLGIYLIEFGIIFTVFRYPGFLQYRFPFINLEFLSQMTRDWFVKLFGILIFGPIAISLAVGTLLAYRSRYPHLPMKAWRHPKRYILQHLVELIPPSVLEGSYQEETQQIIQRVMDAYGFNRPDYLVAEDMINYDELYGIPEGLRANVRYNSQREFEENSSKNELKELVSSDQTLPSKKFKSNLEKLNRSQISQPSYEEFYSTISNVNSLINESKKWYAISAKILNESGRNWILHSRETTFEIPKRSVRFSHSRVMGIDLPVEISTKFLISNPFIAIRLGLGSIKPNRTFYRNPNRYNKSKDKFNLWRNSLKWVIGAVTLVYFVVAQIILFRVIKGFNLEYVFQEWLFWEFLIVCPAGLAFYGITRNNRLSLKILGCLSVGFALCLLFFNVSLLQLSGNISIFNILSIVIEILLLIPILQVWKNYDSRLVKNGKNTKKRVKGTFLIGIIIIGTVGLAQTDKFLPSVKPIGNEPPIPFFWSNLDSNELNETVLNQLKSNNYGLIIDLPVIELLNSSQIDLLETILDENIQIYLNLNLGEFVHKGNTQLLGSEYEKLRGILIQRDLLGNNNLLGITIDAEYPDYYINEFQGSGFTSFTQQMWNNVSTETEMQNSSKYLEDFIGQVNRDGLDAILVTYSDYLLYSNDEQNNINRLTHEIPVAKWDGVASMVYKYNHFDENSMNLPFTSVFFQNSSSDSTSKICEFPDYWSYLAGSSLQDSTLYKTKQTHNLELGFNNFHNESQTSYSINAFAQTYYTPNHFLSPRQVIELNLANGYNACVIADTDFNGALRSENVAENEFPNFTVIKGQYWKSERIDLIFAGLKQAVPGPSTTFPSISEVLDRIEQVQSDGGIVIVPDYIKQNITKVILPASMDELVDWGIDAFIGIDSGEPIEEVLEFCQSTEEVNALSSFNYNGFPDSKFTNCWNLIDIPSNTSDVVSILESLNQTAEIYEIDERISEEPKQLESSEAGIMLIGNTNDFPELNEICKEITIAWNFGFKKVFLFTLQGFLKNFGVMGLSDLRISLENRQEYKIEGSAVFNRAVFASRLYLYTLNFLFPLFIPLEGLKEVRIW